MIHVTKEDLNENCLNFESLVTLYCLKFTELTFFMLKTLSSLLYYSILHTVSIDLIFKFMKQNKTEQKNNAQTSSIYCETQLKNPHLPNFLLGLGCS